MEVVHEEGAEGKRTSNAGVGKNGEKWNPTFAAPAGLEKVQLVVKWGGEVRSFASCAEKEPEGMLMTMRSIEHSCQSIPESGSWRPVQGKRFRSSLVHLAERPLANPDMSYFAPSCFQKDITIMNSSILQNVKVSLPFSLFLSLPSTSSDPYLITTFSLVPLLTDLHLL
jgi:hypothetical protein